MTPVRIYISVNQLPRTEQSLDLLLTHIRCSLLRTAEIILCHSTDWDHTANLAGLNITLHNTGLTAVAYEFPALRKIWMDSQHEDFRGLYLHCKGSSKTDETEWQNAVAWAEYMLMGVVDQAQRCLRHMDAGADLVGSQWHWHWKGNFYWFRSAYIRQLVDPFLMDQDYRQNCEHWCSYAFWWGRYSLPRIRNLFYIPGLVTDTDYLSLKTLGIKPNFDGRLELRSSFADFLQRRWYGAFDSIQITADEFAQYSDMLPKFLNYDGVVINTDTQEIYAANSFLYRK